MGTGEEPPAFDLWVAIVGEEPLLARLPPPPRIDQPTVSTPRGDPSLARGLVILTRLALVRDGEALELELSGAGPVAVHSRVLATQHLLLWIDGAGAMPSFTLARPSNDALAVVAVRRDEGRVEVEVELGAEWVLSGSEARSNGASVRFVQRQ